MQIIPQAANSLPARSFEIQKNGAMTMADASLPSVVQCIANIKSDPVLGHIDFSTVSFAEFVFKIMKQGTVLERSALAKNLTMESAYFFPSAWNQVTGNRAIPLQSAIDNIFKPMFTLLADHFGVAFNGNMDSVAYTLLTEFGGMSFADFLICFDRVKSGRYWRDTQHIMTRGINYEFMAGWLNEYAAERELARAEIYRQNSPDNKPFLADGDSAKRLVEMRENNERKQRDRLQCQRDADDIFTEWEQSLFTSGVIRQGFKNASVGVDDLDEFGNKQYNADGTVKKRFVQQEIICDPNDPDVKRFSEFAIRTPNPGAMERKMKRIIYEFLADGDSTNTISMFSDLCENIRRKYSDSENVEAALQAELKTLVAMFGTIKRQFSPNVFIEATLRKLHPNAPDNQIMFTVTRTLASCDDEYFNNYLPNCIKQKFPRLDRFEFSTVACLNGFVEQGFDNPFKQLLQ